MKFKVKVKIEWKDIKKNDLVICPLCEKSSSCSDWDFELSSHHAYYSTPRLNGDWAGSSWTKFKCPKCKDFSQRRSLNIES